MKVRVLHVVTYMGRGGLETMLMNYFRHIDRSKVQFDFLVHRDFEADYDQEIQAMGGHIYHVSRLVPWSKSYRTKLKTFFREHPEYKIVHVHQDCLSSVALQCAKECGIPLRIAHSHNSSQDKNLKYLIKRYYMKQIPVYATDFFACSKLAGDWMFGGHSFQILYNAIDANEYVHFPAIADRVREELSLGDSFVIGHVGRFNPQKNHAFLIDIFAECVKINPNVKLLLVGDGEGRIRIQEKVHALCLQDKVIFASVRADVNKLLQAMDVFVFPSLYEGLPVTLVEAQASGLSCIISDHVSEECIVTRGLVTSKRLDESPTEWAEHILKQTRRPRESHIEEIKAAGYDVLTAAKRLETFYLQSAKE
ncbi:MAG: glycosyltransferase family 1 protein [Lachnospiraceae bacterium]|nr:glycosyltransferase family 1 protein [Lachnospiraceae bacterium]